MTVKPLNQIKAQVQTPSGVSTHDVGDNNHSEHAARRSEHYHKVIVSATARPMDMGAFGVKATERLNPNSYGASVRRYPGLAN